MMLSVIMHNYGRDIYKCVKQFVWDWEGRIYGKINFLSFDLRRFIKKWFY
jgi:hypothetical protein